MVFDDSRHLMGNEQAHDDLRYVGWGLRMGGDSRSFLSGERWGPPNRLTVDNSTLAFLVQETRA